MTHPPIEPGELAALAALATDDPRRLEAMRSPRTAALLLEYERFLAAGEAWPGAEVRDAEARLAATIERKTAGEPAPAAAGAVGWHRRLAALLGPGWLRPALATGLLLLVAGTLVVRLRAPASPDAPAADIRGGADAVLPLTVVDVHDSTTRLMWPSVRGAASYEIEILGSDLHLLSRHETADTVFDFGPGTLGSPAEARVRVTALAADRPLRASELAPISLR